MVLIVFATLTFAIEGSHWTTRIVAPLLLIGQLPLAVGRFSYTEVSNEEIHLDVRVRRRRILWSEVAELELGGPHGRPPRIRLTDGSEVKSLALGGFVAGPDADPALIKRLELAAQRHGFGLTTR